MRRDDVTALPRTINWLLHVAARAEVCVELGDVDEAARLSGLLAPYAAKMATSYTRTLFGGPVALNLGGLAPVLGRLDAADAYLADAVAACRRGRAAPYLTRSLLRHAAVRRRLGDDATADALTAEAAELAHRLGLEVLVTRARAGAWRA